MNKKIWIGVALLFFSAILLIIAYAPQYRADGFIAHRPTGPVGLEWLWSAVPFFVGVVLIVSNVIPTHARKKISRAKKIFFQSIRRKTKLGLSPYSKL